MALFPHPRRLSLPDGPVEGVKVYLKSLEIHGFKTFAEKTQVVFSPGITCIVGPNGSGKSNISDAVLWVLGENNVRELRGSSAQDVIFAGNDRRRPLGMAEVSLTIDNSARIVPLDFSEITVTRRLYRSGESEYSINKVSCRLKDIYELFLDTGVGRDAYSMINQGEIDQILSVRAEDRRAVFEEAAGIKKYRVRKREAERKLEHTQQNLLRVNDIVAEIETQLGPLQRQAAAARRYRELAVKLRDLETAWYGMKLRRLTTERGSLAALVSELNGERKRLDAELLAAQESEKGLRTRIEELDTRAEARRREETAALQRVAAAEAERARAEERAGEVQRRLRSIERDLDELANRIREQVERADAVAAEERELKRELDTLRAQLRDAQNAAAEKARAHESAARDLERLRQAWVDRARRHAELAARVQSAEARATSLAGERGRVAQALQEAEAELARLAQEHEAFTGGSADHAAREQALAAGVEQARRAVGEAEAGIAAARGTEEKARRTLGSHEARLQALSELGERGEGAAAGAKLILQAARKEQLPGKFSLLVEGLRVPEGLEKAVEAALGVYADALLCHNDEQAGAALTWLRSRKASALLLPGTPAGTPEIVPGSIAGQLSGEGADLTWAQALLGRTVLVEDLAEHPTPSTQHPAPSLYVTRAGEWRTARGAVSGGPLGADGSAAAALARRRDLDRLREELPDLRAAASNARDALAQAEVALKTAQTALGDAQAQLQQTRLERQSRLREADRRKGDVDRARHRVERVRQDAARVEREHAAAVQSLEHARATVDAPPTDDAHAAVTEQSMVDAQAATARLELQRREADGAVADLRVRLAQMEQRVQSAGAAARRAVEAGASLDRQRADRLREQKSLLAESEQRTLTFGTLEAELADAKAHMDASRAEQAAIGEERAARAAGLNEARKEAQSLDGRFRELLERCHRAEVELNALDTQRQNLGQQWLDAAASGHSLEASLDEAEEVVEDAPLLTVEGLLAAWDAEAAELTLTSYSEPEAEVGRLRRQIRSLGAVNPDAVEQFSEISGRYEFLTSQRADLEKAREQLLEAIREIDVASRDTFLKAFQEIAAAFDEMFKKLFGGGTTELRLTDPSDVLETGIDIVVQPPGKRQQNLLLLSGGERALTAAAMLFALLKVKPSPFCVMDEVDAPLDEGNVGRFTAALQEFSEKTQFIVVTHNRATMEAANTLYGVTMQERGISSVLSCSLDDPVVAQVEAEQRTAVAAS